MKNQFNFDHWHNSNEEQPDGNRVIICYHTLTKMFGDVGKYSLLKSNYRWAYLEDLDPEYGKTMDTSEQKPSWSEEDETNLNEAIYFIRREPYRPCDVEPIVDWLRTLKERMKGE